jgi:hypothetical protein
VIWLLFAAALAVAAFLRFDRLGVPCYWLDEILGDQLTARAASAPIWQWITGLEREHGPLYYATQLAARIAGRNEWTGRLVPALCGLAAVAIAGLIARKAGERAGGVFAVAMMTAVSPLHVYFSREARPYGLLLLLASLAVMLLMECRRQNAEGRKMPAESHGNRLSREPFLHSAFCLLHSGTLPFAIVMLTLLYTTAVAGPLVAAIAAAAAIAALMSPDPRERRTYWKFSIIAVAALALFPLLYRGTPGAGDVPVRTSAVEIVRAFSVSAIGNAGRPATLIAMFLLASIGVFAAARRDRRTAAILVAMTILPVALAVATLHAVGHWFAVRYVIAGLPAFLVLAGIGIAALSSLAGRAELAFTIVIAGALAFDLVPAARREPMLKLDWRAIASTLEHHARPGDVIIAGEPWSTASLGYYLRDLPPGVKFSGLWELPSAVKAAKQANAAWLVSAGLWGYGSVREWMCGYPLLLSSPLENFRLHFAPSAPEFVLRRAAPEDIRAMAYATGDAPLLLNFGGADDLLLSGAWGTREGLGSDAFRWVTARESSVTFPYRGARARTIQVSGTPLTNSSLPPQTMRVSLNGGVAGDVTMNPYSAGYTLLAPAPLWREGLNVLTLTFGRATAPATLDRSSNDQRTLAAAITRIVIDDPIRARPPMHSVRLASASLLDVRCVSRGERSRFDRRDYDRAGVEALLARLGFDPVESWPRVVAGDYTIEEIANTAAIDNACVDPASFLDRAFAALLARSPNSVERRDLLARMRTGASRSQIVGRILRADGFRQSVLRATPATAPGRS